jgi:hypothetical protein
MPFQDLYRKRRTADSVSACLRLSGVNYSFWLAAIIFPLVFLIVAGHETTFAPHVAQNSTLGHVR